MSTQLVMQHSNRRNKLLTFTCWAVWLVVIPMIAFSLLILARPTLLDGRTNVNVLLPLPISLVPLALVLISTIGIWQRRAWGVLLYGAAGLLGVAIMILDPNARASLAGGLESALIWVGVTGAMVFYTWLLWTHLDEGAA